MAERGGPARGKGAGPRPRVPPDYDNLVTPAGGGTLDFAAMLAIADILPVMVGYIDRDFCYRFVNKPLAEWIGRPRQDILGKHMSEMLGKRAFAEREPLLKAALTGERQFLAGEIAHAQRGTVAIQTDYVPWADSSGRVNGIIALVTDVTEQRDAVRALRESEARFRRIADSAPAMMWVTRLDRVRDFVNEAYARFVCGPDCDPEQARTIDWRTRIHPDDVERIVAESIAGEASLQALHARGPLPAPRRRVALAAERVAAALRAGRRAGRVHRGGDRHHPGQGGRARPPAPGRGRRPPTWRGARRSSARSSTRCWR